MIDAFKFLVDDMPEWFTSNQHCSYTGLFCEIETLEGTMTARHGDWIIKGVNGEIYPCKPDIFEKTYEAVDNRQQDNGGKVAEDHKS